MAKQFDPSTGQYAEPIQPNRLDYNEGGGNKGGIIDGLKDTDLQNKTTDPTRWSDYLRDMLGQQQASGGGGGGGYTPKELAFGGFSPEYNAYREAQRGRIEDYMDNPRGYTDEEFAMMQGRNQDAITAQGQGYRQMMQDALSKGGMASGSLYGGLDKSAQNTQNNISNMNRDLALQDMDIRRQQQQAALGMGNQWAGQMSSDDRWLTEGQASTDAQNEANRARAISAQNSGRNAYQNRLLSLQNQIGQMDIEQMKYNNNQFWMGKNWGGQNQYAPPPELMNNPYA